jgi:hypothetical protein
LRRIGRCRLDVDARTATGADMRHADTPSGPGKPLKERRDAVTAQEESDEMAADAAEAAGDAEPPGDAGASARHADRNAHANTGGDGAGDNASGGT